jgi:class 3 adenylate cyclase
MDDVRAVMDAAGSERGALLGSGDGAAMAVLFAATYPERTAALILSAPLVRGSWAPDFPWAPRGEEVSDLGADENYASPEFIEDDIAKLVPSRVGDAEFARWSASSFRLSASPSTVTALVNMNREIDVRAALPTIRAPTLVAHPVRQSTDPAGPLLLTGAEGSRYVSNHIPGARYVERTSGGPPWAGDFDDFVELVRSFVVEAWEAGAWEPTEPDRVLSTVLFTDIVDSTTRLSELGDAGWREPLKQHHAVVRRELLRHRGREVDTAGDGFFASFDGPARGVRCASAIIEAVRPLGLELRVGLHAGECELIDGKIGGIAVHLGARIAAAAAPGEVLVSGTIKDLVAGSGLEFEDRGAHTFKGFAGEWPLFVLRS